MAEVVGSENQGKEGEVLPIRSEWMQAYYWQVIHHEELGINQANCYLYMQGHSVFNLVNRIGRALLDESFEYQVLIPSFSIDNDYQELNCIKKDIAKVFVQSN